MGEILLVDFIFVSSLGSVSGYSLQELNSQVLRLNLSGVIRVFQILCTLIITQNRHSPSPVTLIVNTV